MSRAILPKRFGRIKSVLIVGLMCLTCILGSNTAASEPPFPDEIRLGVRITVPPIADASAGKPTTYKGFCNTFAGKLESYLQTHFNRKVRVKLSLIENDGTGNNHPVYDSLTTSDPKHPENRRDIQCGPNTKRNDVQGIAFSNKFYETGIKLLIKKDVLQKKLSNQSQSSLSKEKAREIVHNKITVGVTDGTTTVTQLQNNGYNISPQSTRNEALNALTQGRIEAFASDAPILRSILKGDSGALPDKEIYTIFPEADNNYLIDVDGHGTEDYSIAISDNNQNKQISGRLISATNDVLKEFNDEQEDIKSIREYELGHPVLPPSLIEKLLNFLNDLLNGIVSKDLRLLAIIFVFIVVVLLFVLIRKGGVTIYVYGDYIHMSQELSQAAEEIQALLERRQNTGLTVDLAKKQIAEDIAAQAKRNPTVKEKLVRWGQSLGDATVSDVVKEIVKLAIRSAGIPI